MVDVVAKTVQQIAIPLAAGGGIRDIEGCAGSSRRGAAKVVISSAAVRDPALLTAAAKEFGRQRIIAAIDAKREAAGFWRAYINGGKQPTERDAVAWARKVEALGAGEILFNQYGQGRDERWL